MMRSSRLGRRRVACPIAPLASLLVVAIACAPAPLAVSSRDAAVFSAAGLEAIRQQITSDVEQQKISGAVALLARNGDVEFFESFGLRDREAGTAMQNDAIFRIYSMTKPITSVAVMMLYEEGHFDITDPVAVFLPELGGLEVGVDTESPETGETSFWTVPSERDMTIEDLLRHTSGLTYGFFGDSTVDRMNLEAGVLIGAPTLAHTVERLAKLPLKHQPGTMFSYSVSTDVLARLVEVISGQRFDEFLEQRVFEPLGMVDTGFWVPEEKLDRFAAHYDRTDSGLARTDEGEEYVTPPTYLSGGGGLVSTASDYLRFCQMVLNGGERDGVRLLQTETVEGMAQDHLALLAGEDASSVGVLGTNLGFGLGFAVRRVIPPGGGSVGELSWGGLASTGFWIDREKEIVGIYMTQVEPFDGTLNGRFRELAYAALTN